MNKIDKIINKLKYEIKYYDSPGSYQDRDYYEKCEAKASILEEILSFVEELKKHDSKL